MIRYGLSTLDELDAIEAKEKEEQEAQDCKVPALTPYYSNVLDLDAILSLNQFKPNPAFQASLDSSGGIQQPS